MNDDYLGMKDRMYGEANEKDQQHDMQATRYRNNRHNRRKAGFRLHRRREIGSRKGRPGEGDQGKYTSEASIE